MAGRHGLLPAVRMLCRDARNVCCREAWITCHEIRGKKNLHGRRNAPSPQREPKRGLRRVDPGVMGVAMMELRAAGAPDQASAESLRRVLVIPPAVLEQTRLHYRSEPGGCVT